MCSWLEMSYFRSCKKRFFVVRVISLDKRKYKHIYIDGRSTLFFVFQLFLGLFSPSISPLTMNGIGNHWGGSLMYLANTIVSPKQLVVKLRDAVYSTKEPFDSCERTERGRALLLVGLVTTVEIVLTEARLFRRLEPARRYWGSMARQPLRRNAGLSCSHLHPHTPWSIPSTPYKRYRHICGSKLLHILEEEHLESFGMAHLVLQQQGTTLRFILFNDIRPPVLYKRASHCGCCGGPQVLSAGQLVRRLHPWRSSFCDAYCLHYACCCGVWSVEQAGYLSSAAFGIWRHALYQYNL